MKKLLHKSCQWLVMLVAMFAMSFSASAESVTFSASDLIGKSSATKGDVTITFAVTPWNYGGCAEVQNGSTWTVSSSTKNISSISVTTAYAWFARFTTEIGKVETNTGGTTTTWTANGTTTNSVVCTCSPSEIDITTLTVELSEGGGTTTPVVKPNFPVEGTAYQIKENSRGMFLNLQQSTTYGTILGATQEALYFTWVEAQGAFTITNEAGLYVGGSTNTWNMSSSTVEYWTVEGTEGAYKLKCKSSKYIGFNDNVQINAFRDKDGSLFSIEPYQAPIVDPDPVDPGTGGGDGSVTFDLTQLSASGTHTSNGVSLAFGGNWANYPTTSGAVSQYSVNTLKFSAPAGSTISKITVVNGYAGQYDFDRNSFSANPTGTVSVNASNYVWEGSAEEVTLTTGVNSLVIAKSITVEYAAAAEPTLYQYRVAFEGYPDGTVPSLTCNNITWTQNEVINWRGGDYITENDIEVTPIDFYDYEVTITHPQGEGEGRILVTYTAQPLYQYRIAFVGYPDGTEPSLVCNNITWTQDEVINWRGGSYITEDDFTVNELPGYTYEVAITHPQAGEGRITVTFTERPVNYFTIPTEAFRKDIDVTYDSDWNEVPTSMYFRVLASDVPGLDSFKRNDNGKQITAQLSADGAESRTAYLTIYGGYDGSQASVKSFDLALADKAFCVTFPKGAFEAANGDLSDEFTYCYDPAANRVTYTFHFYNSNADAEVPADLAVVYANAPEGDQYTNGSNYVALYTPSASDFTSLNPYWEIDPQRSNVNGTNINLYFTQQPYKYDVIIEGNDNAGVKVNGVRYANGETVETYELLHRTDVTFLTYKGYNLITANLQDPEDGKGGVIYAKHEAIQYAKATFDHANPAVGEISLDNSEGIHYLTLYFKEDLTDSQSFDGIPAGVTMTDEKGTTYTLSNFGGQAASEWMSSCINIATEKLISAPGTYTLHIPAGIFYFGEKEDMVNDELDLVWTITARQHYDLDNSAVQTLGERKDPTNEWSGLKTLTGFEITLPAEFDAFMFGLNKLYIAPEGGMYGEEINVEDLTEASGYSMALVQGTNTIRVSFDQTLAPAEPTYYSYIIPAGAFRTTDGLTNKQINLSASVDPTVYFDLVVTYPAAGNAQAPVDHITVQLPEGLQVSNVDGTSINFNDYNATVEKFEQNGRELTITFADHAAQAGDEASYYIPSGAIVGTDITAPAAVVPMANSTAQQYNIPVTAAPVEYLVEFAGLEGVALPATPTVTYNNEQYAGDKHIIAVDLTVDQLTATDADGYGYVITIDQPGYVQSHGFGRILVTYTAKEYAAVSSVSPAEGEISLDNAEGLGSITIFMDGEAGWDENVYCGGGNPVPAGVSMVGPNGAIELPWEGSAYGFCMWAGSNQINVNFGGTLKTPGQYTLIIPAGLNTIGGKENPRMEYTWTVVGATTFEFDRYVEALGDRNNDGVLLSLNGFKVGVPENVDFSYATVDAPSAITLNVATDDEEEEEGTEVEGSFYYSATDNALVISFPVAYSTKGHYYVSIEEGMIEDKEGLSNKAFSTSFYVDPNPTQYISLETATAETKYTAFNEITEYSVTSNDADWAGIVLDITAEMLANKTITVSYYTQEEGTVNLDATVESVSEANGVVTFQFTEPVTIPFDTWYSVIFPEGFITFDVDNIQSSTARFNNHKLVESYVYDVVYDETVPEGASLLQNGITIPVSKESFGGPVQVESADFTATAVLGMKPVITIVQPTREAPVGTITLSYEDNRISMAPEDVIHFEGTVNAKDDYTSISKIYINAPEGRTYETIDLSKFSYYVGEDLVAYPEDGISYELNEEQNVVTITLEPAYSTVGTFSWVILDGGLVLDGGTVYAGANSGIVIVPPYDYATVSRVSPAESTIALEDEYDGLRYITIYFKEKITENFTAFSAEQLPDGFSFTDPDGKEITLEYLTGWADSDNIGITTKSLQRTLGEYKLHIPEGIFTFEGGKKNPVLDYTWTLTAPSTFAMGYYDIAADGQVKSDGQLKNLYGFTLTAPEGVTFASVAADAKVIIPGEMDYETGTRTEDEEVEGATITLREDGTIYVGFEPAYAPAEYTSYSFVIPAGAIIAEDGRTSKEIRLSASVDPVSYFDLVTATEKETTSKTNTFNTYTITSEYNAWANLTGLLNADSFKGEVEVSYGSNVQSQPVAGFTVNDDKSITLSFAKDFTVPFEQYYTVKLPAGFIAFPDLALTSKKADYYNNIIFEKSNLEGVELNTFVGTDTKDGITAVNTSYGDNGTEIYDSANGAEGAWPWGIIKVSSDRTIRKVELTVNENASSVMEKAAQGEFSVSGNVATWTGSSHDLVFSSTSDIYVSKLVVYYDADEVIVTENTVTLAESDTNGGQVGKIETHLNLTFTENFATTHSYYNGQTDIPAGVKLVRVDTPSEEPIAIEQFNYFDGKDYLSIVLAESVTAGGTYKLVIPEGVLPFGNRKSNAATTVTWTISPDDISLDGKEDLDDVDAIADIILETSNAERYDASKADLNDDGQVTIGDLVKYIEYLKTQSAEDDDTPIDEEVDEEL